jgi:hypothetical protein
VPELSRFYGIVVRMYFDDHPPPHFHAEYGSFQAVVAIDSLAVIAGELPPRALGLVTEWAALHRDELRRAWSRAVALDPPGKIAPLS